MPEEAESQDSQDTNSQTKSHGKISTSCFLFVKIAPKKASNIPAPTFFVADLLTAPQPDVVPGDFRAIFQPVLRQWKDEAKWFSFYLFSVRMTVCVSDTGRFFNIYGIS